MSTRANNIRRFISSARNLALVQLLVGLALLGAATAGTYYIHKEIRADRLGADTPAKAADTDILKERDDLLKLANDYYEDIGERDAIIVKQNGQIEAGNAQLDALRGDIAVRDEALATCRQSNQCPACPACETCPAPVVCPPPPAPRAPCTYDGKPCLDVIAALEARSGDAPKLQEEVDALTKRLAEQPGPSCDNEIESATANLAGELAACREGGAGKACEVNGMPCEVAYPSIIQEKDGQISELTTDLETAREQAANQEKMIADLKEQLAAAEKASIDIRELQIDPAVREAIDPRRLEQLEKQAEPAKD